MNDQTIPDTPMAAGEVRRVGDWAVGVSGGEDFAVSRRCRHQLADLSKGTVDADGCLVCPWHASRYDVTTGAMVDGPQGILFYRGRTPGYSALVRGLREAPEAARRPRGAPSRTDHGREAPVGRPWAEPNEQSSSRSASSPGGGPVERCTPAARPSTPR